MRIVLAAQDDTRMLTGSGDQCVHLWDTSTARGLGQFRGHSGSVKSVCPHPTAHALFASGAHGAETLALHHMPVRVKGVPWDGFPVRHWHDTEGAIHLHSSIVGCPHAPTLHCLSS